MTTDSCTLPHETDDCATTNVPRENIIKIHYADNETGPAQLLSDRLAVIMAPAFFVNLWEGDLVRLSHNPCDNIEDLPRIVEVITRRHCENTFVEYHDEGDLEKLIAIFRLLDADCQRLTPPNSEAPRMLLVGHHHSLDPVILADVIGIEQSCLDLDESDEDGPDEPTPKQG